MKNKTLVVTLWISSFVSVLLAVVFYIIKFKNNGLSDDPEKWAQFGEYFGGILNPFFSVLNLIILAYLSIRLVKSEEERNKWTLQELARPYGEIEFSKNTFGIDISVQNIGLGPMIITDIIIKNIDGISYDNFSDIVAPKENSVNVEIHSFRIAKNHCAIGKDSDLSLLKITGKGDDLLYKEFLENVIINLQQFSLEIKYNDMYKRKIDVLFDEINFNVSTIF